MMHLEFDGRDAAMNETDRHSHWQNVYATKAEKEVSWFQENPTPSLEMIAATGIFTDAVVIDVGGGASRLVDSLLDKGFSRLAILDLSDSALEATKMRLGRRGGEVNWIVADIATWTQRVSTTCGTIEPPFTS